MPSTPHQQSPKSYDPSTGHPAPGDMLAGKYRVERVIGVGGMGIVVAARHVELDERVAVKFLLPHVPPHGEPVARFIREARAAIKIKSEHVVRVLDVGRLDNGAPYIVMEYLEGLDLAQLVERHGPLSVRDAARYVLQACEALAAAHALGIVHRDLKPANLFLTTTTDGAPRVKVLDFGISKISESTDDGASGLTSTATIMGTPCFMSPEQLRSTRDVDGRADIWSLGAILYALLAGVPPYEGESNADVSAKIIRDEPPPLRSVRPDAPEAMEAIVQRCLAKDIGARFADVPELARALAEVAGEGGASAALRVAKVATAVAPTLRSNAPPPVRPLAETPAQAASTPTTDNPTRTASSWGESDPRQEPEAKASPRPIVAIVLGAAAVAALVALGVSRVNAPVAPAAGTSQPMTAAASASAPASATTASSAAPSASTAPSTAPSAAPSLTVPPSASAAPSARHAPSAKPPPSAAPSASARRGLFDDRE